MNAFPFGESSSVKKGRTRQSGTPWTRSGCLTCKKRRKACDKTKPRYVGKRTYGLGLATNCFSCNNCLRQGRTCEGYGSMWVEPLGPSAQVFSKVESPKRRRLDDALSLSPSAWSLTPPEAWLEPHSSGSSGQVTPGSLSTPTSPEECGSIIPEPNTIQYSGEWTLDYIKSPTDAVIPRPQGYISHLSCHETHYLQYHMEQGSRLLSNLESKDNPLRSILIPRAMSSPLLMKAVCAVSALHLANRSHGSDAHTAAVKYYSGTLNGLRKILGACPTETLSDNAILAVGMLCKYEIVRGSVKQWSVHLNALQRLIVSRGGYTSIDRPAAEFLRGLYMTPLPHNARRY